MTNQALPASFGPARPQSLSGELSAALGAALAGSSPSSAIVTVTVPAPVGPVEPLLDLAPAEDGVLWAPPGGPTVVALGAAAVIEGHGEGRITQVRRAAETLFASVVHAGAGDGTRDGAPALRCFGGFSFVPGSASAAPWTPFGDARFVLPRLTYTCRGERAWLGLAARREELASEPRRRALLAAAEQVLASLRSGSSLRRAPTERAVVSREEAPKEEFCALVESARRRIAEGAVEKIVVARRTSLTFDAALSASEVLVELSGLDACTRFAIRTAGATFLGATPERLIHKSGLDVDSEALAGSSRSADPARARELLESRKERAEHAPVVREIVQGLSPLCSTLEHPDPPEVRALRHLMHLRTPIRGRLAAPLHVLDLVERLHPTPAVGGAPRDDAVKFIVEREPSPRGWYASPVGWFDAAGDGEFMVGLRSGVLEGRSAHLYAGGGIVRDSDPESEYEETRLKLAALCAALHVAQ